MLSVLARGLSPAEAAARSGAAESQIVDWVGRFVEAGTAGLRRGAGPGAPGGRRGANDLAAQNRALRAALCETRARARVWQAMAGDNLGPCATLS